MASKDQNIPLADAEMKIPKVFISYNHKDQEVALKIKDRLERAGIEVIIDVEAMATGENIEGFIKKCIKESGITLSLISANSLMSAWVAMETIWSSYDETLRGRYFMPCNIDNSIFERSFPDRSLDVLDQQIKEIDNTIQIRLQKGRGIEDITNERTRINHLKVELPSIIGRLKNSLCVNLSDSQFDTGMVKVISDIINTLNIKGLTDLIETQTKLSADQPGNKQLQKTDHHSKLHVADEIKMGRILYKIADTMQLNRTERCEIRIAKKEISLIKLLKGLVKDKVKIEGVKISDDMEVKLVSSGNNAFKIVSITNQEQLIDDDSFTQWIFDVTPLMTGNQLLTLVVSIITRNIHDKEIKKDVVFERIINVVTSKVELKTNSTFEKMDLTDLVKNDNNFLQNLTNSSTTIIVNSSDKKFPNDYGTTDKGSLKEEAQESKWKSTTLTSFEGHLEKAELSKTMDVLTEDSEISIIHGNPYRCKTEPKEGILDIYNDHTVDNIPIIEMIFVKGGEFVMGDNNSKYEWEKPACKVGVSDFYIGKYPVTQRQWVDIMGYNPSYFKGCDNCPVESVSWYEVQEFIQKLNIKTGINYRLPTEEEWEYAAGGWDSIGNVTGQTKYAGTNNSSELGYYAWYYGNSGCKTHPVGTNKPNRLGIYDMSGNVWEWCNDRYGSDFYKIRPIYNPVGSYRVLRGGSWFEYADYSRIACRFINLPDCNWNDTGFRLSFALQ